MLDARCSIRPPTRKYPQITEITQIEFVSGATFSIVRSWTFTSFRPVGRSMRRVAPLREAHPQKSAINSEAPAESRRERELSAGSDLCPTAEMEGRRQVGHRTLAGGGESPRPEATSNGIGISIGKKKGTGVNPCPDEMNGVGTRRTGRTPAASPWWRSPACRPWPSP